MVVLAWVISVIYESETMVELVEVKSATVAGPSREAGRIDDADAGGVVEKKAPVVPKRVEAGVVSKPAAKDVLIEKDALDRPKPAPLQNGGIAHRTPEG